jgi:hypothetical protein
MRDRIREGQTCDRWYHHGVKRIAWLAAAAVALMVALWLATRGGDDRGASQPRDAKVGGMSASSDIPKREIPAQPLRMEPPPAIEPAPARTPPDAGAARAEREALLAGLAQSGPAHEVWEADGRALFDAFAQAGVGVGAVECAIAGCGATLDFASQADHDRIVQAIEASAAFLAWTGGKTWSPPEFRADGHVVVALVLYRPD